MIKTLLADMELRPSRVWRIVGAILLGLALLGSLLALATFPTDGPDAWLPYLGSTVLFALGYLALFNVRTKQPGPPPLTWPTVIILLGIVIVAAFMRYYKLDSIPFGTWRDEANISHGVEHMLSDPTYRPIFIPDNVHPTHLYALVAVAFTWFGVSTASIRAVTSAFGVLSVIVAFFLGRELYGNRFGLICAFLLAILRWNIIFSRFGIPSITAPFFELLSLWLLFRAHRTNRPFDYVMAGLAFGYGLNFYTAFRLFALVVVGFVALDFLPRLWTKFNQPAKPSVQIANWAGFAVATALAIAPIVQFALFTDPDLYWSSASEASIFAHHDNPDITQAILSNTVKHLLMFNYVGDNNGRHNLPGQPMLDPIIGALFILGLALAISQPRSALHWIFLLVMAASLIGGILSVDYEAPQANRTVAVTVAVMYFGALAVETLWRKLEANRPPTVRNGLLAVMAGVGALTFYLNFNTYFVQQANSNDVWAAFNGIQSLAADRMLSQGGPDKTTYYASVFLYNHETIKFLAPQIDSKPLIPPNGLPVHEPGDKPVMIIVDTENHWIVDEAHVYYPQAEYHTETTPAGNPAFDWILIQPEQLKAVQGLTAQYWTGDTATGAPAFNRVEPNIDTDWPRNAPVAEPFVAEWDGVLYAPTFGQYQFSLLAPSQATLWIDNVQEFSGVGAQTMSVELPIGNHQFRLQANSGQGAVQLSWQPPDSPDQKFSAGPIQPQWLLQSPPVLASGLLGAYYPNDQWSGAPAFTRVDPFIDTYFHIIPLQRPYTVDWKGQIQIPADGDYAFGMWLNGQATLIIDDQKVLDLPTPTEYTESQIHLTTGPHKIEIRYLDNVNASQIHLYWTPPGQDKQIVPSSALIPTP